jgi:signal transduction histidine kinase
MKHLFEPFYTSLRNEGGSGLGTYTVYNLVTQRFGGVISATSQPGQGLEYRIILPIEIVGPGSAT